jgi:hypothetical protein
VHLQNWIRVSGKSIEVIVRISQHNAFIKSDKPVTSLSASVGNGLLEPLGNATVFETVLVQFESKSNPVFMQ